MLDRHAHTRARTHTLMSACIHVRARARAHTHTHQHTHTHTHTHTQPTGGQQRPTTGCAPLFQRSRGLRTRRNRPTGVRTMGPTLETTTTTGMFTARSLATMVTRPAACRSYVFRVCSDVLGWVPGDPRSNMLVCHAGSDSNAASRVST